jgi:hypothetical protein
MHTKRKNTSDSLRQISRDFAGSPSDPYYSPSQEDLEAAKHYHSLATKNDNGTLTVKEAQEISEMLEEENPLIVDTGTERWVETT